MHRYDVMRLAHTLSEAYDADFGYSLRLAWQVYRVLKDKAVSAAFWQGFSNAGSYVELLVWDAVRQTADGRIESIPDYFDEYVWDEFNIEFCDMLESYPLAVGWQYEYRLSAYGESYMLSMRERMYNAAVPVNLFSESILTNQ